MKLPDLAKEYVDRLGLLPHPEGGFYKETYRSETKLTKNNLPNGFIVDPVISTAIYFLLTSESFSAFHKIKSDELWHFYDGDPLDVYQLTPQGPEVLSLGRGEGLSLQGVVPASLWFGSRVRPPGNWSLVGCTVAPGFSFEDFELGSKSKLSQMFPSQKELIASLTRLP